MSTTTTTKKYPLIRVPVELKRAIAVIAEEREISMNDVIVEAVAKRFSVDYAPTGRFVGPISDSPNVELKFPARLYEKVHKASSPYSRSAWAGLSIRKIVISILQAEYGKERAAA